MKTIFFGATELGYDCCEALIEAGQNIVGIFTIPQDFDISYSPGKKVKNYMFRDFRALGEKYSLPVFEVNQNLKQHQKKLEELSPDFLLAIGWYYMLPKSMLKLFSKGAAGIHASLLPKYRGNAPLVWAMINGEKETGISFFYFSDGVDEGDIIGQKVFSIEAEDTIRDLLNKTKLAAIEVLLKCMPEIAKGNAPSIPQDHRQASIFPKRSPEDGLINWDWDAERIRNFIRAQTKPYPGAYTYINGKKVIIWDASIIEEYV